MKMLSCKTSRTKPPPAVGSRHALCVNTLGSRMRVWHVTCPVCTKLKTDVSVWIKQKNDCGSTFF